MMNASVRKELTQGRTSLMAKLKREKIQEVASAWTKKQARQDIDRQARGEDVCNPSTDPDHEELTSSSLPPMNKTQEKMFGALTTPLVNDFFAQQSRRLKAILALMACWREEEGIRNNFADANVSRAVPDIQAKGLVQALTKSVVVGSVGHIRRCFVCVAKACSQGEPGDAKFDKLCREFCSDLSLAKHFISVHLDYLAEVETYECPICHIPLDHKRHIRLHAEDVHGICTARKRQMRYKGE